ncbi:hypothetical protein B0H34DRAFT_803167 [Crassisporium funariophilum]|nr:hypothetical protein B0H34DRAFT_803167 [Crassisporium funariophilum]
MRWASSFVVFVIGFGVALVEGIDVTVFGVVPPQTTDTTIVSGTLLGVEAVGTVNGGAETVYRASEVNSLIVYKNSITTQTYLSTPSTVSYTFRADASRLWFEQDVDVAGQRGLIHRKDACVLDGQGGGSCQQQIIYVVNNGQETVTATAAYTGLAKPLYTITGVDAKTLTGITLPTASAASRKHASLSGAMAFGGILSLGTCLATMGSLLI